MPYGAVLPRTPTRTLVRHNLAMIKDLTAPDTCRLAPLDGAGQASQSHGAAGAQCLRPSEIGRSLGEPQLGIVYLTGQARHRAPANRVDSCGRA